MTPKISIIVPVYNVEKRLPYCLDSILKQTFQDFEVICVNDGSQDNSLEVLNRYAQKDTRIKVISQENQGQACARNTGIEKTTGEYIFYIDSDDYIHPQCLEILYEYAKKYDADLVNAKYERVDDYNITYSNIDINNIPHQVYSDSVLLNNPQIEFNVWARLYRSSTFSKIKYLPYSIMEDGIYIYEVFAQKPKTISLNEKLYFYVRNPISVSHKPRTQQQLKEYNKSIEYVLNLYKNKNLTRELNFLLHTFIPFMLSTQLKHCHKAPKEIRKEMYDILRKELYELNKQGYLQRKGHKLKRYLIYKMLLWGIK